MQEYKNQSAAYIKQFDKNKHIRRKCGIESISPRYTVYNTIKTVVEFKG